MLAPNALALIFSHDVMPRNGDVSFPYRAHSDMYYLTGILQEETCLLLCPDHPDPDWREVLFIEAYDPVKWRWNGKKLTAPQASIVSGIQRVEWISNLYPMIDSFLEQVGWVYYNPNENVRFSSSVVSRDLRFREYLNTQKLCKQEIVSMAPLLKQLRVIKQAEELVLIRKACAITRDTFLALLTKIKPGMGEFEIEAWINFYFTSKRAARHAFEPIVASGENACTLHYIENNAICREGEMILIDFGAEYSMYASDCTRTVPVNGVMSPRQREVYQATLDVFHFARSIIKPGKTISFFHDQVCSYWMQKHIDLGLYSRQDVDAYQGEKPIWFEYYMHGTSHFIGLDVHDVGDLQMILQPGMVISCEPGIYIPEEKLGIRLETDLLITEEGNKDLMEDIPVEINDIEALMRR